MVLYNLFYIYPWLQGFQFRKLSFHRGFKQKISTHASLAWHELKASQLTGELKTP